MPRATETLNGFESHLGWIEVQHPPKREGKGPNPFTAVSNPCMAEWLNAVALLTISECPSWPIGGMTPFFLMVRQ